MTARLKARWAMLSLRERGLILVMVALLALVLLWLGLIRPVQDGLARAEADHVIAVDRAARIGAVAAALKGVRGSPPRLDGAIDQVVAQSAGEAGFTLDSANLEGPDRLSIAIGAAQPAPLRAGRGRLEAGGIGGETSIVDAGAGGTVSARAMLRVAR